MNLLVSNLNSPHHCILYMNRGRNTHTTPVVHPGGDPITFEELGGAVGPSLLVGFPVTVLAAMLFPKVVEPLVSALGEFAQGAEETDNRNNEER